MMTRNKDVQTLVITNTCGTLTLERKRTHKGVGHPDKGPVGFKMRLKEIGK